MKTRLFATFVLVAGTAMLALLVLNWIQPTVAAQSQPTPLTAPISKPNVPASDPVPGSTHVAAALQDAPLMFVENVGQFDTDARFQVRRGDTTIYLADDAIWFTILERAGEGAEARKGVNLKLSFPGANPHLRLEPFERLDTHVSYFVGSDPDNWRTDVPAWGGVRYVDIYPGVDVEITGKGGHWAWRLVARNPQSTALHIRLRIDGADALALGDGGHLHLTTAVGEFSLPLLQTAPSNLPSVRPEIQGTEIIAPFSSPTSFSLVPQDAGDSYATFLGGTGDDISNDVAVDGDGDAYIVGSTTSVDFPVSTGTFSDTLVGGQDDFVFKIHPAGDGTNDRVYATYIGGIAGDSAGGIAVDSDENVYITGWSNTFFPDTPGSFASCDDGGAFVTKLNDTGTALLYSGCLAGINAEGQDITLDSTGQAYVSGRTGNTFLTTSGAYQETYGGGDFDAFLAIVSSDGVTLTYATYLG
ncbi:MAG: hypothetical protein GY832_15110, partial [Chloroflexi bacterium]|nr:hypothetical protein [Chloroflexota bacterium]